MYIYKPDTKTVCLRDEESTDHVLLRAEKSQKVWVEVARAFGFLYVPTNSVDDLFSTWIQIEVKGWHKERWMLIFFATIQSLWMDRDSRDFN